MQMPFDISVLFDSGRGRPYMPTAGSLTNNHMIQTIVCLVYHMLHIHPWSMDKNVSGYGPWRGFLNKLSSL